MALREPTVMSAASPRRCWLPGVPPRLVQFGTSVAAVHPDGPAPRLAQRVEHMVHQFVEGLDGAGRRRVVDA